MEPARIIDALLRAVEAAGPEKGVTGSQAAELVRTLDPSFRPSTYGARSLRAFIEQNASELKVIAHRGLDPLYGLKDWSTPTESPAIAEADPSYGPVDLWRVWVSPESPFVLALNPDGEPIVRAIRRGQSAGPKEVVVAPLDSEGHRTIAKEFLNHETVNTQALRDAVIASGSDWWKRWLRLIPLQPPPFVDRWHDHRGRALEDALRGELQKGLGGGLAQRAFDLITEKRRERSRRIPPTVTTEPAASAGQLLPLMVDLLDRMTADELRVVITTVLRALDAERPRPSR